MVVGQEARSDVDQEKLMEQRLVGNRNARVLIPSNTVQVLFSRRVTRCSRSDSACRIRQMPVVEWYWRVKGVESHLPLGVLDQARAVSGCKGRNVL